MKKNMLPYPGRSESHESWMQRCDEWEQRRKAQQDDRYASTEDGRGMTEKQRSKLAIAEAKLPLGWRYGVTNDNKQINLYDENGEHQACASSRGAVISGWTNTSRIYINRACAAVWGQQPLWR